MVITNKILDTNFKVLAKIGAMDLDDFATVLKMAKIQKWASAHGEDLTSTMKSIEAKFDLRNKFEFDEAGNYTGENPGEVSKAINMQKIQQEKVLSVVIEPCFTELTDEDLSKLKLSASDVISLENLGLYKIV